MDMHAVDSSLISHLGYDFETRTLGVCFVEGGRTYHYPDVPFPIYDGLRQSPSIGRHFSRHIRGHYSGFLQPDGEEEGA